MPRYIQKLKKSVGPHSNFCGRLCDYWLYHNTPHMEIPYYTQEELMSTHSCI